MKDLVRQRQERALERHPEPDSKLTTGQLHGVLDYLIGKRLTGYRFECGPMSAPGLPDVLVLIFEDGTFLRYTDIQQEMKRGESSRKGKV